jgi:hypothetical protein
VELVEILKMAHKYVAHNLLQVNRKANTVLLGYLCCQWPRGSSNNVLTALLPAIIHSNSRAAPYSFCAASPRIHLPRSATRIVSIRRPFCHFPSPPTSLSCTGNRSNKRRSKNVSVTVTALHAQWVLCMYLVFDCHVDVGFVLCAGMRNGQL